jgi:hypothetical protein
LHEKEQSMSLRDYIQGGRKGKHINRLERRAMQDRLLADALEGYDKIKGDHINRIEKLQKQISQRTYSKNNDFRNWSIVVSFLLIIALVSYLFLKDTSHYPDEYVVVRNKPEIKLQVPKATDSLVKVNKDSEKIPSSSLIEKKTITEPIEPKEDPFSTESTSFPVDTTGVQSLAENENEYELDELEPDTLETPKPVVGSSDYAKYLKSKITVLTDDDCKNAKGKVVVAFHVGEDGRPFRMNVKQSLCPAADEEAIRLIQEGPAWTTGSNEVVIDVDFE